MIYLDNGATSFPKPPRVSAAVWHCMRHYAGNAGRGAHKMSVFAAEKIWETRSLLASLFHIENPEVIVFTQNCTEGLNLGIKGILRPGDDVVISDMEHNSVYRPCIALAEKGVRTLFAEADDDGTVRPEAILKSVTPRTRMVCLQHASNVGGGINPIREIGKALHKKGILFMVDAAQTAGCVDIDVMRDYIDILAFPGHKGLLGPQGTGGLYVREGIDIHPLREGGTGSSSESPFMPDFLPDRLESGTLNLPGIVGLLEGVRFVLHHGAENIGRHERNLSMRFAENIKHLPGVRILGPQEGMRRTGVISLAVATRDAGEIADILNRRYGIAVRSGLHCAPLAAEKFGVLKTGSVRFSPGVFTSAREMDYAFRSMREILS